MGYIHAKDVKVHFKGNKTMLKYPFKNKNNEWDTMYIPISEGYELISKNDLEGFMHLQNRVKDFLELEFYHNELSECYICSNRKQKPIKAEFLLANSEGETKYICLDCAVNELNNKSSQEKKTEFDNSFVCSLCEEIKCKCTKIEKQIANDNTRFEEEHRKQLDSRIEK